MERTYDALLEVGDLCEISGECLSSYAGQIGRVAYLGRDRIEVEIGEAVIPFLPCEVEPFGLSSQAGDARWVYAE